MEYKYPVCKGSWVFKNNCGHCERCVETNPFTTKKREHLADEKCWCEPELIGDYTQDGGTKHYLHREIQ